MMKDTDFHMIADLKKTYEPAARGVVTAEETDLIRNKLAIAGRTDVELQNVRDMSVMLYSQWAQAAEAARRTAECMALMDAMSAITAVIDAEKSKRGLEV